MNFNDKFLNVCFKTGKILSSVLLVISLLITIGLLWNSCSQAFKVNSINVTYNYDVNNAFDNLYSDIFGVTSTKQNKSDKTAKKEEISKNEDKALKLLGEFLATREIPTEAADSFRLPTDDKQSVPFVKAFIVYYDNYISEFSKLLVAKANVKNPKDILNILKQNKIQLFNDAFNSFADAYDNEKSEVDQKKVSQETARNTSFIAFLISLGIFVLFLFLPILIRIEENTRK